MFSSTVRRHQQKGVETRDGDEEGEGSPWV